MLLHFAHPRLVRLRLLRFILTVPIFLHRGAILPTWVLRKKSRTVGLHLSSASRSPTRHFCFPYFVASLALARIAACWSFHLYQCLKRWSLVW